jgi:hypothetical protein
MPALSPRHWKSYTGVLVGLALGGAVIGLDGVGSVPIPSGQATIAVLSVLVTACFAGALGFIALALVPAWERATPAHYRSQFVPFLEQAERFMPHAGRATAALLAIAVAARAASGIGIPASLATAAAAAFLVVFVSLRVNVPINRRMRDGADLDDAELVALRARWARGHAARTLLAALAMLLSALHLLPRAGS